VFLLNIDESILHPSCKRCWQHQLELLRESVDEVGGAIEDVPLGYSLARRCKRLGGNEWWRRWCCVQCSDTTRSMCGRRW
jgi:hypothetical protein